MAEKIIKACMVFLYGKSSLDGYYTSTKENKDKKNYVFDSVFPSRESMNIAMTQTVSDK